MIAIIDYDAGNIKSVEKALQYLGEEAVITRDREEILGSASVWSGGYDSGSCGPQDSIPRNLSGTAADV